MEFAIVPMTSAHLEQIEALEKICFSDPWSRKTLEDMVSNESAVNLAAVDPAGLVLGYISLCRVLDEGYINNVAVRPEARRQGVATALLQELRRQGGELAFISLEVRESTQGARTLYDGLGYREAGRRRGYYFHPKEDAIIMTLELKK